MAYRAYDFVLDLDNNGIESCSGRLYNDIYETLEFLNDKLFHQYVPCLSSRHVDFLTRLSNWMDNVQSPDEKRALIELVPELLFFGRDEFIKLHQSALSGPVTRWIIDILGLQLDDPMLDITLGAEMYHHTWYCPITDSMPISEFHHVNHIGGIDHRPDFRSLFVFGDEARVLDYMNTHTDTNGPCPLKRIVLLEDFVGAGTQLEALEFAARLSPNVPVLFIPMIICPRGVDNVEALIQQYSNLSYKPLIEIPSDLFLNTHDSFGNLELGRTIRQLAEDTYAIVVGDDSSAPLPYYPLGCWETGALVVMYTNTPANTVALVHHESNTWQALFPRSARIR